jgi:hypothetical protein
MLGGVDGSILFGSSQLFIVVMFASFCVANEEIPRIVWFSVVPHFARHRIEV